jgi:DNA-binding IclR family transcriptional regulator
MDRVTSLYKSLDLMTLLAGRAEGCHAAELAFLMNRPRGTVIRILNSLLEYGFVVKDGRTYRLTEAFDSWACRDRSARLRARYRPLLEKVAGFSGELVLIGALEGAGVVHLDYIEQDHRVPVAPAPATHHGIRHNAIGKLILSQRPDLAADWVKGEKAFAAELADIRREGVAWNRGETVASMVAMATHGFTRAQTDAKIAVAWPRERFNATKAKKVLRFIREAIGAATGVNVEYSSRFVSRK